MFSVALIGTGNIGSRQLQAIKLTKRKIDVYVAETNIDAMNSAQDRYNEIPENLCINSITYIDDYKKLPDTLDVVIISTSASVRYEIAEWIVKNVNLKYMILEKVVFQSIKDFEKFDQILKTKKIKIWVNCARRMFDSYKMIKNLLFDASNVEMTVDGTEWGLACNSIHMLDIYSFITHNYNYSYDIQKLEKKIYDSKRSGFKEFYGEIDFISSKGSLKLICNQGKKTIHRIQIKTKESSIEIDEQDNIAVIRKEKQTPQKVPFNMELQSRLTNILIENLYDYGNCDLPSYEESEKLHKVLLLAFQEHIFNITKEEITVCPIT